VRPGGGPVKSLSLQVMQETLRQLGEIALGSIPTIIIFLIVYVCYRFIVHKPMARVLAERYERTEGAVQRARADISAAEAKTSEYEQRLREARATIFKAQETRRQAALAARTEAVRLAREKAAAQVTEARARIAAEAEAAKSQLLPEVERLAAQVIQSVLKPVTASAGGQR
jgi:F-type H+-transporting ATPase subunit b